LTTFHGEYS
jgi:hypothetical protein